MGSFFKKTKEEMRAWLEKYEDVEEPCGVLACSPEIYAQAMKQLRENRDSDIETEIMNVVFARQFPGHKPDNTSGGSST